MKKLRLLLQKNFVMRKRQWKTNFVGEILIPLSLIFCLWMAKNLSGNMYRHIPIEVQNNTYHKIVSKTEMIENGIGSEQLTIYFSPNNNYTKFLIEQVVNCLDPTNSSEYATKEFFTKKRVIQ